MAPVLKLFLILCNWQKCCR